MDPKLDEKNRERNNMENRAIVVVFFFQYVLMSCVAATRQFPITPPLFDPSNSTKLGLNNGLAKTPQMGYVIITHYYYSLNDYTSSLLFLIFHIHLLGLFAETKDGIAGISLPATSMRLLSRKQVPSFTHLPPPWPSHLFFIFIFLRNRKDFTHVIYFLLLFYQKFEI